MLQFQFHLCSCSTVNAVSKIDTFINVWFIRNQSRFIGPLLREKEIYIIVNCYRSWAATDVALIQA